MDFIALMYSYKVFTASRMQLLYPIVIGWIDEST